MTLTGMSGGESAALAPETRPKAVTILCVDDEHTALELRRALLESAGYKVLVARSGAQGLRLFNSEPVHAVVVDYWMAEMNGLQLARQIRRLNRSIPIIVLSAYGELLDESLGLADVWIRKGEEDPQYLLNWLRHLLKPASA
jgi:CheY-like chemotaxis protein